MPTENVIKNIVKSGTTYEIHDDRLDNFTSTYVLTYNDPVHSFADAYAAYQAGKILVCVNNGVQYRLSRISTEYMEFSDASVSDNELNGTSCTFYPNGRWYTFNSLGLIHVEASTEAVQGADTLKSIQVGTVPYNIPEGGSGSVEIDNLTIVESDDGKLMTAIGGYIEPTDGAMVNRNGFAGTDMDGHITHAEMEEFFSTIQPDTDYAVTVTAVSVDPSSEVPEFSDAYFRCSEDDGSYDPTYRIGANADCLHFTVTDAIGEHTDIAAELYFNLNEDRVHCYFGNTGLPSLDGIISLLVSFEDVAMRSEVVHKIDERAYTNTKLVVDGNGLYLTRPDANDQQHIHILLDDATMKTDKYGHLCTAVGGYVTQEYQPASDTTVVPGGLPYTESDPVDRDDTNEWLFSEQPTATNCNFAIYRTDVEPRVQVAHGDGLVVINPDSDQTQSQIIDWCFDTAPDYALSYVNIYGHWHNAPSNADKLTAIIGIDAPDNDGLYEIEIEPNILVDVYHPIDNRFIQLPQLPAAPSVDGEYNLHCSVVNGEATYSWVSGGGDDLPDAEGGSF